MKCTSKEFGMTKNNEQVVEYTLTNAHGHYVNIINYGGIITGIHVPDRDGIVKNIVLSYDNIKSYEDESPFFGCITGRMAGRIAGANFTINDTLYTLEKNDGDNNLHGGPIGLDKRIWSATEVVNDDYAELTLSYVSPHMDQGFPGTLDVMVSYKFDDNNDLTITYRATSDSDTICTLTNHSYFNLSGDPSTAILDHLLTISADDYVAVGADILPTQLSSTHETAFDFRTAKNIGQDIHADDVQLKNANGYDHAFVLNKDHTPQIILEDPQSGRKMEIKTTDACVVCYTANSLNSDMLLSNQVPLIKNGAVCLETQYYPNAINADFLPTKILKAGEIYLENTVFSFR